MFRRALAGLLMLTVLVLNSGASFSGERIHVIEMITQKGQKLFVPDYLEVEIGDTVRFVNVSGNHNTESMRSMIPEGASRWKSALNNTFDLRITHEGVYGYRCTPHYRQAMVGLIVAGNPNVNLERARQRYMPPRVAQVFDRLFAKATKKVK